MKINLPVLILRGIVLLPNNDIRLEFDNSTSKNIIDVSEMFHDSNILVISNPDLIEEEPDLKKLPKLGVIAKINNRMDLPNGKTRVVISGIRRARVHELLNTNKQFDIMESIVSNIENIKIDPNEENILVKKLCRELEKFVKVVPTMSNSLLATISTINNLSKLTDIVAPFLPLSLNRLNEYLLENDSKKRCEYLLSDIYRETQMYEIEKEIDLKVKQGIDESQKEFILREKIKTINYDIVICSPLVRAKHTAKIINVKEKEMIIDNRLEERNPGSLSGQSLDVTNREEYWNYNTTIKYGTSEDIKLFFDRVYNFLDELKTKNYESVLIVAHSGVSKAFYGYFEGIENGLFLNKGLKNCEIKEYQL